LPVVTDSDQLTLQELQCILDEEIGNLPEKYALPLTLCYLEGKTNSQAAEQLGWPEGSISRRLSRARELLRSRLVRRGLAMSAALIAAVFARPAAACSPSAHLVATTASAGNLILRGVPVEEVLSRQAATVIHEVLRGYPSFGRMFTAALLASGSVALAVGVVIGQLRADNGPRSPAAMVKAWFSPPGCATDQALASQPCHHDPAATITAAAAPILTTPIRPQE
jgi:hypothetical protein